MNEAVSPATMVVWGGFVLAFIFGAVANKTNFCTMGAISDVVNMEHWGRMRMWLLTIAVAIIGTNLLVLLWFDRSVQVGLPAPHHHLAVACCWAAFFSASA